MMKAKIIAVLVLAMIVMAAHATIYRYDAKDGKAYFTEALPTGLTTAEKGQYQKLTQAQVDSITKTPTALSNRDAVKAIQKKDNAVVVPPPPVVTCTAPQVLDVATNKCITPVPTCIAPQVLNPTTNKCETPIVVPPVEPPSVSSVKLPNAVTHCGWEGGTCAIRSGVTARVYIGAGGYYAYKDNLTGNAACTKANLGDPKNGYNNNTCYWIESTKLVNSLDPKGQNLMPYVNAALTPVGSAGFSTALVKPAPIPQSSPLGAFRISCEYSHGNFDDPIVYPGVPNATHHHTFFGNTGANAYSTNESLRNSGNGTCAGGILNRSGYWMPSLIDTSTGAPQKPAVVVVYYKVLDGDLAHNKLIKPPPPNLRMIAGNVRPLSPADTEAEYMCQDTRTWAVLWTSDNLSQDCTGSTKMLRMAVSFPQCWDGKNLDSPDHKSHMAYACGDECMLATGKLGKTPNACPVSHPVLLPNITINADFFNLRAGAKLRLSSDNYSTTQPGGYSLHADWMNGWDEATIGRVVKNCLNESRDCGGPNLGDGQTLYGVNVD